MYKGPDFLAVSSSLVVVWLWMILGSDFVVARSDSLKRPGDSLIGALVGVHRKGSDGECSQTDLEGILTVEAILYALDEVNRSGYLDLISALGCDIRDTCPSPYQAALDLVVNSKTRTSKQLMVAALGDLPQNLLRYQHILLLLYSSQTPYMSCISSTYKYESKPGLILRTELIFRVVPTDVSNIRAIVDFAAYFNWTYVAVVYDDSNYGRYALDLFKQAAESKYVCVSRRYALPSNASDSQIQQFVKTMKGEKNFSVIVMLTSKVIFKNILDEAFKQKISDLTWIAGDAAWDSEAEIAHDNTAAQGMFTIGTSVTLLGFKEHLRGLLRSPERNKWLREMVALNIPTQNATTTTTTTTTTTQPPTTATPASTAQQNASSFGNATTTSQTPSQTKSPSTAAPTITLYTPTQCNDPSCSVNKTLLARVVNELITMAESAMCTIDSVFAVAHALVAKENCTINCPERHEFYRFIQNVNFKSPSGRHISFDSQRNLSETEYKIWNFQKTDSGSAVSVDEKKYLQPVPVGSWKKSGSEGPVLTVRTSSAAIQWNTNADKIPKSLCNDPCRPGTYKLYKTNRSEAECCWHCVKCPNNAVSGTADALACTACPDGTAANSAQDGCITQFEDYVFWNDAGSLVMIFVIVAGMCFSIYVTAVLLRNRDTPVVRRGKNAVLGILPIIIILFLIPIPLLCKPSASSCDGYRAFFILGLGIPLALLIAKSVFVDNKYYDAEGQLKESWANRMCSPRLVYSIGIIVVHIIFTCVIVILLPNEILRLPTDDPYTVYIECSFHTGFGFLFVVFYILAVATVYSILSMSEEVSPENDMEVRWTSFCMFNWYALCFFYVVFAFGVPGKSKIFALSFIDFLFVLNVLACIYLPKWYVIVFQPEKNQADVSPWSMYVKTQEKVSVRLSEGKEEESPVLPKRGTLASTAKESNRGRGDEGEAQELISYTDV